MREARFKGRPFDQMVFVRSPPKVGRERCVPSQKPTIDTTTIARTTGQLVRCLDRLREREPKTR